MKIKFLRYPQILVVCYIVIFLISCWYAPPTRVLPPSIINTAPSVSSVLADDGKTVKVTFSEDVRLLDFTAFEVKTGADAAAAQASTTDNDVTGAWVNGKDVYLTVTTALVKDTFIRLDIAANAVEEMASTALKNALYTSTFEIKKTNPAFVKMRADADGVVIFVWMSEVVTVEAFAAANYTIKTGTALSPEPSTVHTATAAVLAVAPNLTAMPPVANDGILPGEVGYVVKVTGTAANTFVKNQYVSLLLATGVVKDESADTNPNDSVPVLAATGNIVRINPVAPRLSPINPITPNDGRSLQVEITGVVSTIDISKIIIRTDNVNNKVTDALYVFQDPATGTDKHFVLLTLTLSVENGKNIIFVADAGAFIDPSGLQSEAIIQPIILDAVTTAPTPIAAYKYSASSNTVYLVYNEVITLSAVTSATAGTAAASTSTNWATESPSGTGNAVNTSSAISLSPNGYVVTLTLVNTVGATLKLTPVAGIVQDTNAPTTNKNTATAVTLNVSLFTGQATILGR